MPGDRHEATEGGSMKRLLALSPLGLAFVVALTIMALSSRPNTARALEVELTLQSAHHNYLNSIIFSQTGRQLISGGADTTAILWDVQSGRTIRRFPHGDLIMC